MVTMSKISYNGNLIHPALVPEGLRCVYYRQGGLGMGVGYFRHVLVSMHDYFC